MTKINQPIATSSGNLLNIIAIQTSNLGNSNDSFDVAQINEISSSDSDNSNSSLSNESQADHLLYPEIIITNGNSWNPSPTPSPTTKSNRDLISENELQSTLNSKENRWIECKNKENRYKGKTRKKENKNFNGKWEYETNIFNGNELSKIIIHEYLDQINNSLLSWNIAIFRKTEQTTKVIWELSYFDETNTLKHFYKLYEDVQLYCNENFNQLDLSTFQEIEHFEDENKQENNNLNEPNNWFIIAALTIIPIMVYARVAQRVFSVNVVDTKEHSLEEWMDDIFGTPVNLAMASVDIIFTSLTSYLVNWSRKSILPSGNCLNSLCYNDNQIQNNIINSMIHLCSIFTNHITITASSMYTLSTEENPFTWEKYHLKLTSDQYNFAATLSRLYAMQIVNYLFNKGAINTLSRALSQRFDISSSRLFNHYFCVNLKKFWKWINKGKCQKIPFALITFVLITVLGNGIKTLASLTAKDGFKNGWIELLKKFQDKWMWCSFLAVTLIDGLNLFLNNYKKIWFFEPSFYNMCEKTETKFWWCWDKITSCSVNNEISYTAISNGNDNEDTISESNTIEKFEKNAKHQANTNNLGSLLKKYKLEQQNESNQQISCAQLIRRTHRRCAFL